MKIGRKVDLVPLHLREALQHGWPQEHSAIALILEPSGLLEPVQVSRDALLLQHLVDELAQLSCVEANDGEVVHEGLVLQVKIHEGFLHYLRLRHGHLLNQRFLRSQFLLVRCISTLQGGPDVVAVGHVPGAGVCVASR